MPEVKAWDLSAFGYVFRVVDAHESDGFEGLIDAHASDLQRLAAILNDGLPMARMAGEGADLARLAQISILAGSDPEARALVADLAAQGVYVQFAYRDFLISQTEGFSNARSFGSGPEVVSRRTLTFGGQSVNPSDWAFSHGGFISLDESSAVRSIEEGDGELTWLRIAEGSEVIMKDYINAFAEAMMAFPGAEIVELDNGSFSVTIGDMTVEFAAEEDSLLQRVWKEIAGFLAVVGGVIVAVIGAATGNMAMVTGGVSLAGYGAGLLV